MAIPCEETGALIVGGSFHSLGAARSLAGRGVPVYVLDRGLCVSQFSRYVKAFLRLPEADDDAVLTSFLLRISEQRNLAGWVLYPTTDEYVRLVAQNWDSLSERYRLTIPAWETVRFLYDKRLTHQLAREQAIPVPTTHNPGDIDELASLNLDFPVVLKPVFSKRFMVATKRKAYRADDLQTLLGLYEKTTTFLDPSDILVQELIPGGPSNLYSYVGFFRSGLPVAGLAAKRPRQHPMDFGRASTYVEVVDLPELEALATEFLTSIAFTGLAEVEFMYNTRSGRFELLEVNPRIWGWHTIVCRAGLDLCYMAYANAKGEEVPGASARPGVKWMRLLTDIPTAASELLHGRLTLGQYIASLSGDVELAVFSFRDPLPFVADLFLAPVNYLTDRGF